MSFNFPVWYLQAGRMAPSKEFVVESQASAVLVVVKSIKTAKTHKVLLTVQHALRTGTDKRSGPFHPTFRAWAPGYGYHNGTGIEVSVFSELTPDATGVFAEPEDLAFLELPVDATGSAPCRLAKNTDCAIGLGSLSVVGFISGDDLIQNHAGRVEYASHPNWRFVSADEVKGICILGPGDGSPAGGVSGGGVFKGDNFLGIYRGAFISTGEHLFLPITRVREWCRLREYDLVDPSATSALMDEIAVGIGTLGDQLPNKALRAHLDKSKELMEKLRTNLALFKSYKNLHDGLHQVQLLLGSVENAAKRLPDSGAADQMDEYLSVFSREAKTTQATIETLPGEPPTLRMKESVWLKQFVEALETGRSGLAHSEQGPARQATKTLRRVLRFQMPRINTELSVSAEAMNLVGLRDLFADATILPGLSDEATRSFKAGQSSTDQVFQRLQAQVSLHSAWQNVDQMLWQIEDALSQSVEADPGDFDAVWNALHIELQKIIGNEASTQWVQTLSPLVDQIVALRTNNIWPDIPKAFSKMQKACRYRFFDVDADLRNLASEVAAIGESLNTLLSKLI